MDTAMYLPLHLDSVHTTGGHKESQIDSPNPKVLLQPNYIHSAAINYSFDHVLDYSSNKI